MGNCCTTEPVKSSFQQQNPSSIGIQKYHKGVPKESTSAQKGESGNTTVNQITTEPKGLEIVLQPRNMLTEEQNLRVSNNPEFEGYSALSYSKLVNQKHFFNVFNPSLSNNSKIQRLENQEPGDSFFPGIPRFSRYSEHSPSVVPSSNIPRPKTEVKKSKLQEEGTTFNML